jgi:transcriptional regulator with XRE-family HTH domain
VGEHLKRARLDRGIRQKKAARSIGCRPATLGTWEKGRVAPDVSELRRVDSERKTGHSCTHEYE